ncbi:MAG: PKD domain-containing protein [Planctomycetota bacterium]
MRRLLVVVGLLLGIQIFFCAYTAGDCTIGVADDEVTADGRPLLWKSRMRGGTNDHYIDRVLFVSDPEAVYNYIYIKSMDQNTDVVWMGVNSQGLCTGNALVSPGGLNGTLQRILLGSCANVAEVREYLNTVYQNDAGGCFPFADAQGEATLFELDPDNQQHPVIEYYTLNPLRQLYGWVVRANEHHNHPDGTDNIYIQGRYQSGMTNTRWFVENNMLSDFTIMQGNDGSNGHEFMRYGYSTASDHIACPSVISSMIVHGVAPGENPLLSTMWAALGQGNYAIAVPTWVLVSDIPDCLEFGGMATLTDTLEGQGNEAQVQECIFPAEAHLFSEVEELLEHWRTAEESPSINKTSGLKTDMTRVEAQMATDAYSLLEDLTEDLDFNKAPTVSLSVTGIGYTRHLAAEAWDEEGAIQSYEWNFGDGQTATGPEVTHFFPGLGWYLVSCTVTDMDDVSTTDWYYFNLFKPDVAVYTYQDILPPGAPLMDGKKTLFEIKDYTWLTWVDPMPGSKFAHDTVYIFASADHTIKVKAGQWWPELYGKPLMYCWDPWDIKFPEKVQGEDGSVSVYAHPELITPLDKLTDAGFQQINITENSLLYWVDLYPDKDFPHPTAYILVSADDKVTVVDGKWWPVLNNEQILYNQDETHLDFPYLID